MSCFLDLYLWFQDLLLSKILQLQTLFRPLMTPRQRPRPQTPLLHVLNKGSECTLVVMRQHQLE